MLIEKNKKKSYSFVMPFFEKQLAGRAFLAYPEKLILLLAELKTRFSLEIPEKDFSNEFESEKSLDLFFYNTPIKIANLIYIPHWDFEKNPYWAATSFENLSIACFESIKEDRKASCRERV